MKTRTHLLPALLAAAALTASCATPPPASVVWGSEWQLQALGDQPVLHRPLATLNFPEPGRIAGNGSCNRFFGSASIDGANLRIEQTGMTRMACAEPVNAQEMHYMKALTAAQRFELLGDVLLIHSSALDKPLRFVKPGIRDE
ncbi:META domain-containing protein [Hydrogenophaga sp. NFH-34]|uniref:META domain-containing protein n=1 Tax=Hydrogenophaga sp. NFH-34 TaxID=2744446 RepID=UPI001F26645E|nr:META domain-containing protein [Hydrogenophaga sp. NFH-34]